MSAVAVENAKADGWNQKTVVRFAEPIEMPGVHLAGWSVPPAGIYVLKLLDSQSDRHIVQMFNKNETIVYATILAVPNDRLQATGKTAIAFSERPAGQPAKALELAKNSNVPVLFTAVEIPPKWPSPMTRRPRQWWRQ